MNDDIVWDGWHYPYIASSELSIDPSLQLNSERAGSVDPITYEVLRYALWNVEIEAGDTMLKISGSPVAVYGHDFNTMLLDELGNYVFFGPYLQYLASPTTSAVKWTLENRAANPGIEPGDIFLCNDPWIGSAHQPDVAVYAPVFVGDKLFCWVGNVMHGWDLGGTAPGGFSPIAKDVFWECPCIPPVKVVKGGELQRDVEEMYTHFSRVPDLVALDLRAQVAGATVAVKRIGELVDRYSPGTVKAVMCKLQDDAEQVFVDRLDTIPDGTWTEESWIEANSEDDRGLYKNRLTLTKTADKLVFTNEGSAPQQEGTLSGSFLAWRGAILSALGTQTLFDQMFVLEGALRHCEFDPTPSLITCPTRPAAVSGAPAATIMNTMGIATLVISKMLACSTDPELRREVNSCTGTLTFPINAISGLDQRGRVYGSFLQDVVGGGLGAWSWRDGVDTGGFSWDVQSTMPNVEHYELFYPVLYLWRRELPDSGGAGKYRGGNGGEFGIVAYNTERISMTTFTSQLATPAPSLAGALPTSTNKYEWIRGVNALDGVGDGSRKLPRTPEEIEGEREWVGAKAFDLSVLPEDVWICAWNGGGGYGDPMLRDPAAVERDVADGNVTEEWAHTAYAVVPGDEDATRALRRERMRERLGGADPPAGVTYEVPDDDDAHVLGEALVLVDDEIACRFCGHVMAPMDGNPRAGATKHVQPIETANPHVRDAAIYADLPVYVARYSCPSCGIVSQCDILVGDEEDISDLQLQPQRARIGVEGAS